MFRNIRWRIAVPYVLLILLTMGGLSFYLSGLLEQAALDTLQARRLLAVRALTESVRPLFDEQADLEQFDALARRWAELLEMRVTIIGAEGAVWGDSHEDRLAMENHLRRPEVQEALLSGTGDSLRYSTTLGQEMAYTAQAVVVEGQVTGYVRVAMPVGRVEDTLNQLRSALFTTTLLITPVAVLLAVIIAERTALPVRRLTNVARRMAEGDMSARLLITSKDEVGTLTRAFNYMGEQLRDKVESLAAERSRLALVLELMADGVLITDDDGRVQLINQAAARLLETGEEEALGQGFAQVVRHYQLIELWRRCQETGREQSQTLEIGQRDLFLQVVMTPLQEGASSSLIILQNLTPIRRLQTVRRDFISNISHELRTPLASLKAVVETLRDAALDDPVATRRFLDRADYEVDALTQMVQELLELSRIESGKVPLRLAPAPLEGVILPVVERLRQQAERNEVPITVDLPGSLPLVLADTSRIQQVVTNLVHNAVKFTPPGGEVKISARQKGDEVQVRIKDTGVGIPDSDLTRIFERFYKADRARSGGGTGLGLAIARHLVQAHGGRIWARSKEGQGSTFYFTLPSAGEQTVEEANPDP